MNSGADVTDLEAKKLEAEIAELMARAAKLNRETGWYPAVVASTMTLAIVAVVKIFL